MSSVLFSRVNLRDGIRNARAAVRTFDERRYGAAEWTAGEDESVKYIVAPRALPSADQGGLCPACGTDKSIAGTQYPNANRTGEGLAEPAPCFERSGEDEDDRFEPKYDR